MARWTTLISGYGLIESPTWCGEDSVVFSDVQAGGVYRLRSSGLVETIVPKRRGVGGIALHADGGLVVSGRTLEHVTEAGSRTIAECSAFGFNDICTGADGAVIAGGLRGIMVDHRPDRPLAPTIRIDCDGKKMTVNPGLPYSNGIRWSIDGMTLYQADSALRSILAYSWDGEAFGPPRIFAVIPDGVPDGVDIDAEGCVWVACFGAGRIMRYDPTGALHGTLAVPAAEVTSLRFGGPDMKQLFVGTADHNVARLGGCLLVCDVDTHGHPSAFARV